MKFVVIWQPKALEELAAIWLADADPAAVTACSHRIDDLLKNDAQNKGESRDEDERLLFEGILSAYYRIDLQDQKVFVLEVARIRRP